MAVIRFEPFRDPFERLFSMAASGTRAPLAMPMDVYRTEDGSYHVEADLPGVDPGSVEVTVEHGTLTIQAERAPHYGESEQVVAAERPQGSFTRQLSLGEGVDAENLTAGYAERCPARDHSGVTQDKGPPDRGQPCVRRQPHHLGQPRRAGRGARWRHGRRRRLKVPVPHLRPAATSRVRSWPPVRRGGVCPGARAATLAAAGSWLGPAAPHG